MGEIGCVGAVVFVLAVLLPGVAGERLFRLLVLSMLFVAVAMLYDLTRKPPPR